MGGALSARMPTTAHTLPSLRMAMYRQRAWGYTRVPQPACLAFWPTQAATSRSRATSTPAKPSSRSISYSTGSGARPPSAMS